jgi:hypothetical protein
MVDATVDVSKDAEEKVEKGSPICGICLPALVTGASESTKNALFPYKAGSNFDLSKFVAKTVAVPSFSTRTRLVGIWLLCFWIYA